MQIFAKMTVPVKFDEICLEIEFHVARDRDFYYDCLIGRNAVQHPDVAVVMDTSGCKVTCTRLNNISKPMNTDDKPSLPNSDPDFKQQTEMISHLDNTLQNKITEIFQKYPNILPSETNIGTVKTGEMT